MEKTVEVGWQRKLFLFSLSSILCVTFLAELSFSAPVDFPKKEISIVVNMGAGGARDILARGLGKTMSKYLGVPIVVMNMPGAGGARGLISLYHAAPDGYTLGIGTVADVLDQILEKQEYDNKRFTYIGRAQSSPSFLFTKSDSPLRSIKDFKAFGKPIRHSTPSLTTNTSVIAMVLSNREKFPLTIVGGYQGGAAAILGLIRGEVEISGPGLATAMPFVRSGQIRPILTIYQKRSPDFPDVPTVGEIGHPDLASIAIDYWCMAPPGVPKAHVQILEDALMKTLKDPEFLGWAKGAGVDPGPLGAGETTDLVLKLFELFQQYKGDIEKHTKETK
jgi:tripartite-type tricarboxylate transporter receptor subunit TctC